VGRPARSSRAGLRLTVSIFGKEDENSNRQDSSRKDKSRLHRLPQVRFYDSGMRDDCRDAPRRNPTPRWANNIRRLMREQDRLGRDTAQVSTPGENMNRRDGVKMITAGRGAGVVMRRQLVNQALSHDSASVRSMILLSRPNGHPCHGAQRKGMGVAEQRRRIAAWRANRNFPEVRTGRLTAHRD